MSATTTVTDSDRDYCAAQAKEMFAEVRRLGAEGLHAEAQAVQERATTFWIRSLGREVAI